jgi:hypothetical protein
MVYPALESSWNVMAHVDALRGGSEGETGEWSGSPVLFTLPRNMVYPALLPLMRTPLLPVVDWTDAPADLKGLVRFAERQNLISARVPSHFKRILHARKENAVCLISCVTNEVQCDCRLGFCSNLIRGVIIATVRPFSLQMVRLLESVDRAAGEESPMLR